jgi:acyl-CoA thioester hydrolase
VDLTDRATYSHWSEDKVRWGDQDGQRHINNVAFGEFLENARTEMIIERIIGLRSEGARFTVRRVAIDYLRSGSWPGRVEVGTCVAGIGETSFTLGQAVFQDDVCLITGETVHVQHRKGERVPLSDELRTHLQTELPA